MRAFELKSLKNNQNYNRLIVINSIGINSTLPLKSSLALNQ